MHKYLGTRGWRGLVPVFAFLALAGDAAHADSPRGLSLSTGLSGRQLRLRWPSEGEGTGLAPATSRSEPTPADSLSFDLLGAQPQPLLSNAEVARQQAIERDVKQRRRLLTAHQALGISTMVLTAATIVLGGLDYADRFGGGDNTGRYTKAHLGLAISATGLFATTGLLALAAPKPYKTKIKFDAALVHKAAMAIAAIGFLAEIVLGPITAYSSGQLYQPDLALAHLIVGGVTEAFLATGVLAFVFN